MDGHVTMVTGIALFEQVHVSCCKDMMENLLVKLVHVQLLFLSRHQIHAIINKSTR